MQPATIFIPCTESGWMWLPCPLSHFTLQALLTWYHGGTSRCTYLTQKYKTTGPDFLGKSCSKTLRSNCSQFKWPLRKTETNGLGLWTLQWCSEMDVHVDTACWTFFTCILPGTKPKESPGELNIREMPKSRNLQVGAETLRQLPVLC